MATRTAVASNLWSLAATWDTGVPVNTDTAVIPVGFDVEFDVDQSGFAAGVTVTLNGTLHASTTAGSYVLKLQANMTGSGTLRAGTSGTPYPTNCTFEIVRGGFQITATTMTLDLNCSEPTTKYIRLSGVEAAGQTVLSVDTDVTGEAAYWADGAIVRICDVNFGSDGEERIIAAGGVAAATLTITAGLTAQKETATIVALVSRNVKITHTAATGTAIVGGTGGTINAEIRNGATAINARTLATIGGTQTGCPTTLEAVHGSTINSVISGGTSNGAVFTARGIIVSSSSVLTGNNIGLNRCIGGAIFGLFSGNNTGIFECTALNVYGDVVFNTTGLSRGGGHKILSTTLNNTTDLSIIANTTAFDAAFSGTTEFSGYNGSEVAIDNFVESVNHDQVANAYKAWTPGGIVTSNVVTVFGTRPRSFQHACESASKYVFRNYSVTVDTGGGLVVQCYIRKDAAMAYLPRMWILEPGEEPFISGTPTAEAIMTNSINTWETLVLVYANSGASPVTLTVRTLAKDAGPSNVYFDPIFSVLSADVYTVFNVMQTDLDDIQTRLPAALVGGRMDSSVGAIQAAALAQINGEVVDALTIDTYGEPAAVPAATSSLKDKIGWLYTLARNKITQTAATQTLRNDGDGGNIGQAAVSDDGATATRGKWS